MATKRKSQITYKRNKSKIEISGDPKDVKAQVWADLLLSRLLWIAPVIL